MENREFITSTEIKDKLTASVTSFIRLYSGQRDRLQTSSDSFTVLAAELHEAVHVVNDMLGELFGSACGGVAGGVCGALGAIGAATWNMLCNDIKADWIVSSVVGGVVGGALGGAVGSAVCVAAETTGSPVHGVIRDVAWLNIGFATGGIIGGIFGGTVGATGGAIGGAFGALCATKFVVSLVGGVTGHSYKTKDSKEQKKEIHTPDTDLINKSRDFREALKPLVEELKTIKTISDEIASSDIVTSVARQTAKTLASVTAMDKATSDCRRASDLLQFVSSFDKAATQSQNIMEELETMRAEVEKLLVFLRKC